MEGIIAIVVDAYSASFVIPGVESIAVVALNWVSVEHWNTNTNKEGDSLFLYGRDSPTFEEEYISVTGRLYVTQAQTSCFYDIGRFAYNLSLIVGKV